MELTGTPWALYFPVEGNTADGLLPPSWVELLRTVSVEQLEPRLDEVRGRDEVVVQRQHVRALRAPDADVAQ